MNDLKIVYMGTPEFGLPALEAINSIYNVIAVVCQPDKVGNRNEVKYCPIKEYALKNNILVLQPESIKNEYKDIIKLEPDMIVTCAYGQIVPKELLDYPKYGCINIHASLLPKLRGGAPIHRAIIEGHKETGVTIMKMVPKMDAGDVITQEKIEILDEDTVGTLHDKLSILGKDLVLKTIPMILSGTATYTKQNESEATFAWVINKEDEHLDFNLTTREIINKVRGLNPFPGCYCMLSGRRLKIWKCTYGTTVSDMSLIGQIIKIYDNGIGVRTSNGEVIITELQLEGKRKMNASEFLNGVVNKDLLVGRILE